MTREEALKELAEWREQMKNHGVPDFGKKYTALGVAIEALTQESRKVTQEFTQDLISRQDTIEAIPQTSVDAFENCRYCNLLDREQVIDIIKSLPSADRPIGEWVNKDGTPSKALYSLYCSECGEWSEYRGNYCLNCGAKMGGRAND